MNEQAVSKPEPRHHLTKAQRYYADFMIDVLVYTVVLNLFVEYAGLDRHRFMATGLRASA